MKVLVAEDDDDTAAFIRRGLGELGHNVVLADKGADALHLLLVDEFDIAIIDRMLPRLDGLQVLQRAGSASKAIASCSHRPSSTCSKMRSATLRSAASPA